MKHERADQVGQRVVAFGTGDDRSHNPDHSDNADDPQQDAKNAQRFFHWPPPLDTECLDDEPQYQNRCRAVEEVPRKSLQVGRFSTDNVRHDHLNSGKRNEPRKNRRDPPPHTALL